jgi:transcriptional regulator with XRE-family HTH domain
MSTKKRRTPVQEAVLALRKQLGLTQQQLAVAMNVTVVTVCRWETSRPPSGFSLVQLMMFARRCDTAELSNLFEKHIWEEIRSSQQQQRQYVITRLPDRAAETALSELRARKDHPLIGAEYVKVLRTIERAIRLLTEQVSATDAGASQMLQQTHEDLKQELRDEENRTKTKR